MRRRRHNHLVPQVDPSPKLAADIRYYYSALEDAIGKALVVEEFERLTREHWPASYAANQLGWAPSNFSGSSSMRARYLKLGLFGLIHRRPPGFTRAMRERKAFARPREGVDSTFEASGHSGAPGAGKPAPVAKARKGAAA